MGKLSSNEPLAESEVGRALVIRPRFVGDLCLTLPVLDHLRRHLPRTQVDYLVEEEYAPLLDGDPRVDQVVTARRQAGPFENWRLLTRLARAEYDLVLDLFCNPRTALWTAATGAGVRVGYPGKGLRSRAYNRHVRPRGKSAVRFHLASIEALGWEVDLDAVPRLHLTMEGQFAADERLAHLGVRADDRVVVLHAGARWPTRRWAPEGFAAVARTVVERYDDAWALVLAGPGEEDGATAIAQAVGHPRCVPIAGLALGELPGLFAAATAFVGGDTGPLHVSAAAGCPTVGIFGRNEPANFFPYPTSLGHRAVYTGVWCSPCHLDECPHLSCLRSISPPLVWTALREILERRAPWPGEAAAAGAPA